MADDRQHDARIADAFRRRGLAPLDEALFITRPRMPDRAAYDAELDRIWETRWLTNSGAYHNALEARVAAFAQSPASLTCNGTVSLLMALRLFGVKPGDKVVTTPFTFPATVHAIDWLGAEPVFADVEAETGNLCPASVEAVMEDGVTAIMATHVYGTPCDHAGLDAIARARGIPLIYDAAHAFGVTVNGEPVLRWGDASSVSFHATKLFSTVEGGAVFVGDVAQKTQLDRMRNFGILNENEIAMSGLNMKMSELHAAFGTLTLDGVGAEIERRAVIAARYAERLGRLPGLRVISRGQGFQPNWSYYAIAIDAGEFGLSRDAVHAALRTLNINLRKYFNPLVSEVPLYAGLPSAQPDRLPRAATLAGQVLCLPIYGDLSDAAQAQVIEAFEALSALG
jgi:dTDP-4-amino-4,6-dideoxygalactose transaminase